MKPLLLLMIGILCSTANASEFEFKLEKSDQANSAGQKSPATPTLPVLLGKQKHPNSEDYAWDEFAHWNDSKNMIWMCRNITSGKLVAPSFCAGKPKIDSQWPDKTTPPDFRGIIIDTRPSDK